MTTTKQWLLELIREKEESLRDRTDRTYKSLPAIPMRDVWLMDQLATIDRARRLVENGPEEP